MRILLDENLPVDLASDLADHEVATVTGSGWQGIKNGELLLHAQGHFDVLITMDRNIEYQQNIAAFGISVIVLQAPSNRLADLRPLVPGILKALKAAQPGELQKVSS